MFITSYFPMAPHPTFKGFIVCVPCPCWYFIGERPASELIPPLHPITFSLTTIGSLTRIYINSKQMLAKFIVGNLLKSPIFTWLYKNIKSICLEYLL